MSTRGAVIVREWRGKLIVQSWPRKRGNQQHPNTVWWQEWFRQANALAKYAPARFQTIAREMTEKTALMPRDVMIMAMRGTLYTIELEGGEVIYPVAGRQNVSTALDLIGKAPGSMLLRGPDLWLPLTIGTPGQILTVGDDLQPEWKTGGGGSGTPYSPPTTAVLDDWYNPGDVEAIDSAFDALVIQRFPTGASHRFSGRMHDYGPGLRTYIAGMNAANRLETEFFYGIACWTASSDILLMWGTHYNGSDLTPTQLCWTANRSGTILQTLNNQGFRPTSPIFYRLRNTGSTIECGWGVQPDVMTTPLIVPYSATGGEPTYYGVVLGWGTSNPLSGPQALSCIHWTASND